MLVPKSMPTLAPVDPGEAPPEGRLSSDVRPLRYKLNLTIDPEKERFSGSVEIAVEIQKPRDVIWMHGRDLIVKLAEVVTEGRPTMPVRFEQMSPQGVVALRLPSMIGPTKATIRVVYDAPFGNRQGLYKTEAAGKRYAFTQMESIGARQAFPSFDEPAWKTPFEVTLLVPKDAVAIANTREVQAAEAPGGMRRVTFAPTEPLPTYLIAFAVGPLDVVSAPAIPVNSVRKRPLALRGVAAQGRGKELAYALARTGPILAVLEQYFGVEYPYDKLDILAVPDRNGAMENAGAVTFSEWLLLLDEARAPVEQQRAFGDVMAHELAHMWFGNLVTMPWWDDIWLNESFATWMAVRAVQTWRPADNPDLVLLQDVHEAMSIDSLTTARQIRQPVNDHHDIEDAFDYITYSKGGGVLTMFERWLGRDVFQKGIREHITKRPTGLANSDDLLAALSSAAGRDVGTPFRTFLNQPGVPLVEATLTCGADKKSSLRLRQSRYFPLGSTGDANKTWQIPVCARYGVGAKVSEACTLLTDREGALTLEGGACADWVMPNADGAGYYRWSLPAADLEKLRKVIGARTVRERMSFVDSVRAGFARGTINTAEAMAALEPLARDPHPSVALAPMGLVRGGRDWMAGDAAALAAIEGYGRKTYAAAAKDLGWDPRKGESPERQLLRKEVLGFMAMTARDPAVRAEAARRGKAYVGFGGDNALHPEAVDPNLAQIALSVAVQESDAAFFDAVLAKLPPAEDPVLRGSLVGALSSALRPELAARARALLLDTRVHATEILGAINNQIDFTETREPTWKWVQDNLEALVKRMPPRRAARLPRVMNRFCDADHARAVQAVFSGKVGALDGGPRNLANSLEQIRLCSARREAQSAGLRGFFVGAPTK